MKNIKWLKIFGLALAGASYVIEQASNLLYEKELEARFDERYERKK